MATKTPSLKQLAEKQIRRLERATRRAVERGYVFDLPFGRTRTGTAKTRYTRKEVEELSRLHLKDLYKYSKYGNETFEYVSGEEYRKKEKKLQAQQAASARWEKERERKREEADNLYRDIERRRKVFKSISPSIVDNFIDPSNWRFKGAFYTSFKEALDEAIEMTSKDFIAEIIQEMTTDGLAYQVHQGYKPEHFDNLFPKFLSFIETRLPAFAERIRALEVEDEGEDDDATNELTNQYSFRGATDDEREYLEGIGWY